MSRRRKDPLRPLTADERIALTRLSRSPSAPAAQVERARALLAISDGTSYTAAAHQVGRRHTEAISAWVSRFNREGLAATRPGHASDWHRNQRSNSTQPKLRDGTGRQITLRYWPATHGHAEQGRSSVVRVLFAFRQ